MLLRRLERAMGSTLDLQIALTATEDRSHAEAALDAALKWVRDAEARLSRFQPDSELCALNRAAGSWFTASDDLFAIVATALSWADATQGLFDPTVLGALVAWGYDRDFAQIAHRDLGPLPPSRSMPGSYAQVQLDAVHQAIRLPHGVGIDLGGIGKGWAADQILRHQLAPFANAMASIGGDIALRGGPPPAHCWTIGIRDPRAEDAEQPTYLGGVQLAAGGIATSGAAWRWWQRGGTVAHHLIDPRTGMPAAVASTQPAPTLLLAVTALAPSATAAEVYAKQALLLGGAAGLTALNRGDDGAGIVIMGNGTLLLSENLLSYLERFGMPPGTSS